MMVFREEAAQMLENAREYEEKLIQDLENVFGQLISSDPTVFFRFFPYRNLYIFLLFSKK